VGRPDPVRRGSLSGNRTQVSEASCPVVPRCLEWRAKATSQEKSPVPRCLPRLGVDAIQSVQAMASCPVEACRHSYPRSPPRLGVEAIQSGLVRLRRAFQWSRGVRRGVEAIQSDKGDGNLQRRRHADVPSPPRLEGDPRLEGVEATRSGPTKASCPVEACRHSYRLGAEAIQSGLVRRRR
jgi:hypothetical protein